jgi:hypothetical protein
VAGHDDFQDACGESVFGTDGHLPEEFGLFDGKLFPQFLQLSVLRLHIRTLFWPDLSRGLVVMQSVISLKKSRRLAGRPTIGGSVTRTQFETAIKLDICAAG